MGALETARCSMSHRLRVTSLSAISGSNWTTMNNRHHWTERWISIQHGFETSVCVILNFQRKEVNHFWSELMQNWRRNQQLTRYLAHTLVVLAAVSGFLTVGVTVAHRFSLGVLKTFVVPAGAAVRALSLPAARLGLWKNLPTEKRKISTNDEP